MPPKKVQPALPAATRLHPLSLVRVVWKDRWWILATWAIFTVVTYLVVRRLPAIYKADSLILVVSQKIPDRYVTATVNSDPQDRVGTISQLILSNTRLEAMIAAFGLYPQERKTLAREAVIAKMRKDIILKLESGLSQTRPDAIRVSYQHGDPNIAAKVCNALAKLIIDENSKSREFHAENTTAFLDDQLKQAKAALDLLEAKVSAYKMEHNGELPQQEGSLNSALSRLQTELQGNQEAQNRGQQTRVVLENNLSAAESSLSSLERSARAAVDEARRAANAAASAAEVPGAPAPRPRTRREVLEENLAALQTRYGDNHPDVRRVKSELAKLPKEEPLPPAPAPTTNSSSQVVVAAVPGVPPALTDAINRERERIRGMKLELSLLRDEMNRLAAERTRVMQDIESFQARIGRLPYREQEVAGLTRDYDIAKSNYRSLQEKKMSAEMASEMEQRDQGEKFTLIDSAHVPERPFKPNRLVFNAVGSLGALALGIIVAAARHFQKDTLLGEWEFPAGVPVLGRVPPIRIAKQKALRAVAS